MTDQNDPLNRPDLQERINLRGTLGISGPTLIPVHVEKSKSMNLIEMHEEEPALTRAGQDALS